MRCRGVHIYAVFALTGGALFALLASTNAPVPPATIPPSAVEPTVEPPPSPPPPLEPDPWASTRTVEIGVLPPPIISGPTRTDVPIDPTVAPAIAAAPGHIQMLAITNDGSAAVTGDERRSVRLWPTLDGKREPLVVAMPPPAMLAIERDGEALVIAGVDAVGQLVLVRVAPTGQITRRTEVGLARPLVSIHGTPVGFVALRDDRVVMSIGFDGMIGAELAADPGEHVLTLAVRDDRVLAIIEREDRVSGRWIDLSTGSWSERTRALPIKGDHVVLSPNHERVAGFKRGKQKVVAIVDLATGKIVDTMKDLDDRAALGGFHSDGGVWVMADHSAWSSSGDSLDGTAFGFANNRVVGTSGSALVDWSPTRDPRYVGYRMGFVAQLRATKTGFLATDGIRLVELDAQFRTRAGFELHHVPTSFGQIVLVEDELVLGHTHTASSLYLFSTKHATSTLVASGVGIFEYEPSTRLLMYVANKRVHVARFDPKARTFEPAIEIDAKPGEVFVLDAADKKGDLAIVRQGEAHRTYTATFGTFDMYGFTKTSERTIEPIEDWWNFDGDPRSLVRPRETHRARSPDRSLVAEIKAQRLVVHHGKTERWAVPTVGIQPLWTPNGELVVFGTGIARVDSATGALRDRQCGFWFGAWEYPPEAQGASSLCEVP